MTRIPGTFKDKGHIPQKILGYSALVFLVPIHLIVLAGERIEPWLDSRVSKIHKFMKPCLYKGSTWPDR